MIRLYLAIGFIASIGLAWWRYDYIVSDRDAQKQRADSVTVDLANVNAKLATERQNAADADLRAKQRQSEKEVLQREYDQKLKCINDGNCVVKLRWGSSLCPKARQVHSTESISSGFNEKPSADERDFARWVADLENAIDDNHQQIIGLQNELEIRSKPDYCKAMKQ